MTVTEEARKALVDQGLAAWEAQKNGETMRVPWRGQQQRMPIIRVRVSALLLNPRSHRIKAQLESNSTDAGIVESNPESAEGQAVIARFLRGTEGFEALKQNLKDENQKEPGIITRSGLLVNANRRAVALVDNGVEYIEVAVLPADAQPEEIYDLELDLQVAETYQTDYTFTNELLFIDDLINKLNRDEVEVACKLRWATPTRESSLKSGAEKVRRYVRHLSLIREIQQMSGNKIPIIDFDEANQTLQEFDTAYQGLRDTDPDSAERLKAGRILGLLVNLGYDRQRMVNSEWIETYLHEAFQESPILAEIGGQIVEPGSPHAETPSGLEMFEDPVSDKSGHQVHEVIRVLVGALSSSADEELVALPTVQGVKKLQRAEIKDAVSDAMRAAAEDAKAAARAGNSLVLPAELVKDAASRVTKARDAYQKVKDRVDFDDGVLRSNLEKLGRALEAINRTIGC